jgi:hypothetical protein
VNVRVRRALLGIAAMACLAASGWWVATRLPSTLREVLDVRPVDGLPAPDRVEEGQARVRTALPAVGLEGPILLEESLAGHTDARGSWSTWITRWRLPADRDAVATGRRLASLVSADRTELDTYVVENGSGAAEVRVYGGSRLAARLLLEPTLPEWPDVQTGTFPLLALVLDGVDHDPHASNSHLELAHPLAVALSPYSPYTLRMARDAVVRHKEVLARVEEDTTPAEALEAVPYATAVLITAPPRGEPDVQAGVLRAADVVVVDASPEGLPAAWMRALTDAGVPRIRAFRLPASGAADGLRAFRARVAREGSGVLVVDADDPAAAAALDSLSEAATHGLRPAFVAEVAQVATAAAGSGSR